MCFGTWAWIHHNRSLHLQLAGAAGTCGEGEADGEGEVGDAEGGEVGGQT